MSCQNSQVFNTKIKLILLLLLILFFSGCTIKLNLDDNPIVEGEESNLQSVNLTTEIVEFDEEGNSYLIVAFPESSYDHKLIFDEENNEWVVIARINKK